MPVFEEKEDILPRDALYALIAVLVATDVFILICTGLDIGTPMWMFYATTAVFAFMILASVFIKMTITVDDENLTVRLIKSHTVPLSSIIDFKVGDVDIVKNYSGWGLKGVKFKNVICIGYERAVSLKLMGRKVITFSTSRPEELVALLPSDAD